MRQCTSARGKPRGADRAGAVGVCQHCSEIDGGRELRVQRGDRSADAAGRAADRVVV